MSHAQKASQFSAAQMYQRRGALGGGKAWLFCFKAGWSGSGLAYRVSGLLLHLLKSQPWMPLVSIVPEAERHPSYLKLATD